MSPATTAGLLANGAQDLVAIRLRAIPELGVGIEIVDLPRTEFFGYPPVFWRVDSDEIWTGSFYVGELEDSDEDSSRADLDATLPAALLAAGFSGEIESMCGNGECVSPEGDVETAAQVLSALGYDVEVYTWPPVEPNADLQSVLPSATVDALPPVADPPDGSPWGRSDWEEVYGGSEGFVTTLDIIFTLRPSNDDAGTMIEISRPFTAEDVNGEGDDGWQYQETIYWKDSEDREARPYRRSAWTGDLFEYNGAIHPHTPELFRALDRAGLSPLDLVCDAHEAYSPALDLEYAAAQLSDLGYLVQLEGPRSGTGDFS